MDSEKNQIISENSEEKVLTLEEEFFKEYNTEGTTIFTTERNKSKNKKGGIFGASTLSSLVALTLCLVLAVGGLFLAIFVLPEDTSGIASGSSFITVKKIDSTTISKIEVENKKGRLVLVSEKVSDEGVNSETGEYTSGVEWSVQGYDKKLISSSEVNSLADKVATITASKVMTNTGLNYGFDNPTATAKVTMRNGTGNYTVTLGNMAPDKTGYYLMISGDEKIYFVSVGSVEILNSNIENMANTVIVTAPVKDENTKASDRKYFDEEGNLAKFDSIKITGTRYGKDILFTSVEDNEMADYLVTIGENFRYAHSDTVEGVFGIMTNGLVAIDTYKLNPSATDVKKYGLDNPEFNITIKYGSGLTTVHAKLYDEEKNYYAVMIDGLDGIYAVTADALSMLSYKLTDFYNDFVFLEYIKDIKVMDIETAGERYAFDLSYDESKKDLKASLDGKKIDGDILSTYYQYLVTLAPEVMEKEDDYASGAPSYKATFTFHDSSRDNMVLQLVKQSDRRFLVVIDGQKMGLVSSADYDALVTYLQYVLEGKEIPEK